jgi:hypothetical protein
MVSEFRAVLRSPTAGFGVRSIVVEAVALGAPMPALKVDLGAVLLRVQSPYAERLYALIALLRIGPDGENVAVSAFHKLGTDDNALRLRAEMIHRMYGRPFGPADISVLLNDTAVGSGERSVGTLYVLSENMPISDIGTVLDGLKQPSANTAQAIERSGKLRGSPIAC